LEKLIKKSFKKGNWSCYHLDELESSEFDLIGGTGQIIADLKNRSLSDLLTSSLKHLREQIANPTTTTTSTTTGFNLANLFKLLAQSSCSLIVDSTLTRTIKRIDIFIRLCSHAEFIATMTERLIRLQMEKEQNYIGNDLVFNWLSKEVANLTRINQFATLRRACASYLEAKLSPLLGFLLSQVDAYANLDTLSEAIRVGDEWKVQLWLRTLKDESLCKLSYGDMR
jgi:hypothetical protein